MRTLSHDECLFISGADDDIFDLGDVLNMIENRETKLLLLGTMLALGAGLYTGLVTYGNYGLGYGILGGVGGMVAGAYVLPLAFVVSYAMVDQSYRFFGFVQ